MHRIAKLTSLLLVTALVTNCASIVSKSQWPVCVTSNPSGLSFTITNRDGKAVHQGVTPATVTLRSGAGFFRGERYVINATQNGKTVGSASLSSSVNGWYLGNIVFGGVIGLLIVDPASGAMYALPKNVDISAGVSGVLAPSDESLRIVSINTLSATERARMIRI